MLKKKKRKLPDGNGRDGENERNKGGIRKMK